MLRQMLVQTNHITAVTPIHEMPVASKNLLNVMEPAEHVEA
jgi:hypothetical protein